MNLKDYLIRRFGEFPNIKPGEFKLDIKPKNEVQRCADMTDSGAPGSETIPTGLMFPALFRNRRNKKKKQ